MKKLLLIGCALACSMGAGAEDLEYNTTVSRDFTEVPVNIDRDGDDVNLRFREHMNCDIVMFGHEGVVLNEKVSANRGENIAIALPDPEGTYSIVITTDRGEVVSETVTPPSAD